MGTLTRDTTLKPTLLANVQLYHKAIRLQIKKNYLCHLFLHVISNHNSLTLLKPIAVLEYSIVTSKKVFFYRCV